MHIDIERACEGLRRMQGNPPDGMLYLPYEIWGNADSDCPESISGIPVFRSIAFLDDVVSVVYIPIYRRWCDPLIFKA